MLLLWRTDVVRKKADMATKSRHTRRTVWQSTNQDEEERRGGAIRLMGDQIERERTLGENTDALGRIVMPFVKTVKSARWIPLQNSHKTRVRLPVRKFLCSSNEEITVPHGLTAM